MIHKTSRTLAALTVLALATAGCGSDDESSNDSTATSAGATESTEAISTGEPAGEPTGEPIKIGNMIWSIPAANLQMRVTGVKAAVLGINESGGINGRPIELVTCEATDAPSGEQCARDLIDADVVATVGDGNLIAEAASTALLNEAGIPQIDPFISTPEALASPNVFLLGPGSPVNFAGVVQGMHIRGQKSFHQFSGSLSTSQNSVNSTTKAAEFYGIEIVGDRTEIPVSAADYSPFVAAATDVAADVQLAILGPSQVDLLMQVADQLGEKLTLGLSQGVFNQDQIDQFGESVLEGSTMAFTVPPLTAADQFPVVQQFLDENAAYYASSNDERAAPGKVSSIAFNAWLDVVAFQQVVTGMDEISAATVLDAMNTVEDIDLGLTHPWTPSAEGAPGFERSSYPWLYISTIEDGQIKLVQEEPIDGLEPWRS